MRPNNRLVAIQWLKTCPGLDADKIARSLARDASLWVDTGFVVVAAGVGGSPDIYTVRRNPVIQLDFYAVRQESGRPPWNRANQLCEAVLSYCEDPSHKRVLDLPSTYVNVTVHEVYPMSEPREIEPDPANYARITCDFQMHWSPVE